MKALAAAALGLHWSDLMVLLCELRLWLRYSCVMVLLRLLLRLLSQPGERLCCGCLANQERINVSAVPTAPRLFFQPLSTSLAYPELSEQCEQQDNWRHEQDEQQYTHHTKKAVYILVYTFLIVFLAIRFLFHTLASYYQVITNYFKITSPWPTTIPVIGYSLFNLMPHLFGHLDHFQIFAVNNTCIAIYVS